MTLEELIVRLQIKEVNIGATKKLYDTINFNIAKANMVDVKKDFKLCLIWNQKTVIIPRSQNF